MSKPIAFKVRTQGHYTGVNGGKIKTGGGGAGALWYEDKTFTIAATQDQWLCTDLIQNKYQFEKFPMQQNKNPIKYLSVCSGMEAATVAWHHMGWQPVGFSEIEPFPSAILKHHYPTIPNYGDLTKYKQWPIEPGAIDLLVGGTPCQSFSVAGLRKGLTDPRGNLALTFLGLADHVKPKWIIWENVPGVLSSSGGRDFGSFLGALVELGYGFAYRVLDAQFVGGSRAVPQRRRRVFVVACLGDWRAAAEVLSLAEGVSGYLKTGNKKRKSVTADAGASAEASGKLYDMQAIGQYGDTGLASTCKQRDYKDATDLIVPTILDRAAFNQGQNAQYEPLIEQTETCPTIVSKGPHAVQLPFRKSKRASSTTDNETWVEGDVSNTLNNFDLGDTRTTHVVVKPIPIQDGREMEKNQNGMGIANPGDPSYTIDTTGSQSVAHPSCVAIQGNLIGRSDNAGPEGVGASENGPMYTLTKTDIHAVCHESVCVAYPINTMTLGGRPDPVNDARMTIGVGGNGDPQFTLQAAHSHAVAYTQNKIAGTLDANYHKGQGSRQGGEREYIGTSSMAVRRLTPVECERLQGFPDNYSQISWKGKPADQCPDGPRYKACGNSMAVNVMRFIGEQINKFENRNG